MKLLIIIWALTLSSMSKGAEPIGIIEDTFFKDPETIVTIRELVPHDNILLAVVDGSATYDSRTTSVKPFCEKTWEYHDDLLYSLEKWNATILCGTKKLEKSHLKDQQHPHVLVRTYEDKAEEPSLDKIVTIYKMTEYTRADGSIYRKQGDAVCDLMMSIERRPSSDVSQCTKEWTITSQWQRKLRHSRRHYSAEDVYHIIRRIPKGLTMTGNNDRENIVEERFIRKELKFKTFEADTPECGTNGGNLPAGSVVI
jgi:hypothetical protein